MIRENLRVKGMVIVPTSIFYRVDVGAKTLFAAFAEKSLASQLKVGADRSRVTDFNYFRGWSAAGRVRAHGRRFVLAIQTL